MVGRRCGTFPLSVMKDAFIHHYFFFLFFIFLSLSDPLVPGWRGWRCFSFGFSRATSGSSTKNFIFRANRVFPFGAAFGDATAAQDK